MTKPVVWMDVMKQIRFIVLGFAPTLAAYKIANRNVPEAGALTCPNQKW